MQRRKRSRQTFESDVPPCATFEQLVASGRLDPNGVEVFDRGDAMGRSVRTRRAFKEREIVCSYGGKCYLRGSDQDREFDGDYKYAIVKNIIIDGDPSWNESKGHAGSYINDANGPIRDEKIKNNVFFSNGSIREKDGKRIRVVWIRALCNINAGDELWLAYGKAYWRSRELIAKELKKKSKHN